VYCQARYRSSILPMPRHDGGPTHGWAAASSPSQRPKRRRLVKRSSYPRCSKSTGLARHHITSGQRTSSQGGKHPLASSWPFLSPPSPRRRRCAAARNGGSTGCFRSTAPTLPGDPNSQARSSLAQRTPVPITGARRPPQWHRHEARGRCSYDRARSLGSTATGVGNDLLSQEDGTQRLFTSTGQQESRGRFQVANMSRGDLPEYNGWVRGVPGGGGVNSAMSRILTELVDATASRAPRGK
jgi:hypothetical protein